MPPGKPAAPKTVEEYLARQTPEMREALERLRKLIRSAAPKAEEVISYQMPAFRHHGMLVFYAAFEDHCSFFVGSPGARRKFARELKPYAAGKGTVRFTPATPLPADLVRRIVRMRVAENEARHPGAARKARSPRSRSR